MIQQRARRAELRHAEQTFGLSSFTTFLGQFFAAQNSNITPAAA